MDGRTSITKIKRGHKRESIAESNKIGNCGEPWSLMSWYIEERMEMVEKYFVVKVSFTLYSSFAGVDLCLNLNYCNLKSLMNFRGKKMGVFLCKGINA